MSSRKPSKKIPLSEPQVITAIIGLIGTIVTAYFSFLAVRVQTEKQDPVVQASAVPSVLPTPISSATSEATVSKITTQTVTTSSLPTPDTALLAAATDIVVDSSDILRVDLDPGGGVGWPEICSLSAVFPRDVDPSKDPEEARRVFNSAAQAGTAHAWPRSPVLSDGQLSFQITNTNTSQEWIRLNNTLVTSISTSTNVPDTVHVIHECAGMGVERVFPPVTLDPTYPEYKQTLEHPTADYFTLQPGEFETFNMTFLCKAPGLYRITMSIDYSIGSRSNTFTYEFPNFVCPKSLVNWSVLSSGDAFVRMESYEWNGQEYIQK